MGAWVNTETFPQKNYNRLTERQELWGICLGAGFCCRVLCGVLRGGRFCWLCGWWCPTQLVAVRGCVLEGSCVVSVRNQGTIGRPNPQWAGHFPNFNRIWGNRPCRVPCRSKHIMFFREPRQKKSPKFSQPPEPEGPQNRTTSPKNRTTSQVRVKWDLLLHQDSTLPFRLFPPTNPPPLRLSRRATTAALCH